MNSRPLALVTGAGRGIGAAIALELARAGAGVIVAARSLEACTGVADQIRDAGGEAWPAYLDVADPDTFTSTLLEALDPAEAALGPVRWLVNNAGIAETAPFLRHARETGEDVYEKHLRVNFHGPRRLIERFVPAMLAQKSGRVVNVASSAGLQGYPYAAAYVASKHALMGYSKSAAAELADCGVTLNVVAPHYVDSPMTEQTVERIVKKTGRDVAATRAFLASQNPGGTLVAMSEVARVVRELLEGTRNGAIAELIGGRGRLRDEETVVWR